MFLFYIHTPDVRKMGIYVFNKTLLFLWIWYNTISNCMTYRKYVISMSGKLIKDEILSSHLGNNNIQYIFLNAKKKTAIVGYNKIPMNIPDI